MDFRRLTDADLPTLHRWLNDPRVVRWWEGDDVSWLGVVAQYGSMNREPVEHWIAVLDDVDVGWIQCYSPNDFADEEEPRSWFRMGVSRAAAGIDYLVGEASRRHRGLGSAMLDAFVEDVVFGLHPGVSEVCASPAAANVASWRALEKAGFRHRGTFHDEDGIPCRLMVRQRAG